MFWKLSLLVLTIGGTMCGLLVLRQQQLDLEATSIDLFKANIKLNQELRVLQYEIDQLATDEIVELWADRNGLELEPLVENLADAGPIDPPHSRPLGEPGG